MRAEQLQSWMAAGDGKFFSASVCSSMENNLGLNSCTRLGASLSKTAACIAGVRSSRRVSLSSVLFHLVGTSCSRFRLCCLAGRKNFCLDFSKPVADGLRWKKVTTALPLLVSLAIWGTCSPALTQRLMLCPMHCNRGQPKSLNAFTSLLALSDTAIVSGSDHLAFVASRVSWMVSAVWEPSTFEVCNTLVLRLQLLSVKWAVTVS